MRFRDTYLSHKGRLSRGRFTLYCILAVLVISLVQFLIGNMVSIAIGLMATLLLNLVWLYLFIALIYKRQHDLGHEGKNKTMKIVIASGVMYVIQCILSLIISIRPDIYVGNLYVFSMTALASLVAFILLIVWIWPLLFKRGMKGPNAYGPDPLKKRHA